ncbi:MAG: helix-turn-helix domain-containing protein [Alphaproteobacteria bacterium]|nr:helix-turn-helix domain-containing protein [Alphaproteobacteria bacterium]
MNSPRHSPQTIGERIKALRSWMKLSRREFSKKYNIHEQTLVSWELHNKSLTSSSIEKLLPIFAQEGLPVTKEWLLDGKGLSPFLAGTEIVENEKSTGIFNFLRENIHSVVIAINDSAMNPFFEKGNFVGGIKINLEEDYIFGSPYIVTLIDDVQTVRILYKGKEKNLYTLGCFNLLERSENPVFYDVPIKELYHIVRLWK